MENNKIYVSDTLQTLKEFPDGFFDITVLSPPYNKMGASGGLVKEVKYKKSSDIRNENEYQDEQINVLNEPSGHIFYNHKIRWVNAIMLHPMTWLTKTKWDMRQEIIWDRQLAGNIRSWRFWQIEERIYWMQKGISKGAELLSKHAKMTSIWKIRPDSNSLHPAPFPIEIPTRCIYSIADSMKGLNVLDPYSGGGTTLSAAKILGHNYVGIDISPEYATMAADRLENASDVIRVAIETNLHVVKKSYKERKNDKHASLLKRVAI
jgi:site-specific DNA-methyltransferase (adenine-specific)